MLKDSYSKTSTTFKVGTERSQEIPIRKGIKQGCPLSPLVFVLALQPLINEITLHHSNDGYKISNSDMRVTVQAYADDVILFSDTIQGMNRLIRVVEQFMQYTKFKVNASKCLSLSIGYRNGKRVRLEETFKINGQVLPVANMNEGIDYLGVMVSNNRKQRWISAEEVFIEQIQNLKQLARVPFRFNQKIEAIKRFITPSLDYALTNGEVREQLIEQYEKEIRHIIISHLKCKNIPLEFSSIDWKDG